MAIRKSAYIVAWRAVAVHGRPSGKVIGAKWRQYAKRKCAAQTINLGRSRRAMKAKRPRVKCAARRVGNPWRGGALAASGNGREIEE